MKKFLILAALSSVSLTASSYAHASAAPPKPPPAPACPKTAPLPTIAVSPSAYTFLNGTSIDPTDIVPVSTGAVSFAISPDITNKTGLAFDATTGIVSGTPSAGKSATTYTISALNCAGKKATSTITVTVNDAPPAISLPAGPYTFLVGAKIEDIVPTLGVNVSSVSIYPDITSTGLSFNTNTGKISGTPTSALDMSYVLTATNGTGQTATASLTVDLNNVVPAVAPPASAAPGCEYTLSIADFQSTNVSTTGAPVVTQQRVFAGGAELAIGGDGFYHVPLLDSANHVIVDSPAAIASVPWGAWEVSRSATSFIAGNSGHQNDSGSTGYVSYTTAAVMNCPITSITNVAGANGFDDEASAIAGVIGHAGQDQYTLIGNTIYAESTTTGAADLYTVAFTSPPPNTPPGPPTITSAVAGSDEAMISFTDTLTGGLPITGYTIRSTDGSVGASGTSSPITVPGLLDGQAYQFTVTATNADGTSAPSTPSAVVASIEAPNAPVIESVLTSGGVAAVYFQPSAGGGTGVTSYTVTASPGGASGSGPSSPIEVPGLTDGSAYTFTVTATNAEGTSPSSAPSAPVVPIDPAGPPSIVSVASNDGSLSVTLAPPTFFGGAPVLFYTVVANPGNIQASSTTSPVILTGLTDGVDYQLFAYVTTEAGSSDVSTSAPGIPEGLPCTPLFQAFAGGPSVLIDVDGTTCDGGAPIVQWTVTYAIAGGPSNSFTSTTIPIEIPTLAPGYYTATVTATNSVGSSAPSAPGAFTIDSSTLILTVDANGQYIDAATGYGVNADQSEFDLFTGAVEAPAPAIPYHTVVIGGALFDATSSDIPGSILTLDPSSGLYATYRGTTVDVSAGIEFDGYGNATPIDLTQVYFITTTGTLVPVTEPSVQLDPSTLSPVSEDAYDVVATPAEWSITNGLSEVD
jgi:hypothetical protein